MIVTTPNPVLRAPCEPVTKLDKKTLGIIEDMKAELIAARDPEGVGLAAPQIGISLQIFLMRPKPKDAISIFINPKITSLSKTIQNPEDETLPKKQQGVYEGCLSVPHHYAPLSRAYEVELEYYTPVNSKTQNPNTKNTTEELESGSWNLEFKKETFTGFPAHIIQHEVDHLNGKLFIDHVLSQATKLYKITGKKWEEVSL